MKSNTQGLIHSITIPPGQGASGVIEAGEYIRIIDVEGQQVFDISFFNKEDPVEHCDLIYSLMATERWKLTTGDVLYTKHMQPLLTIVEDTCGTHEWTGGFCSHDLNNFFGQDTLGCRETMEREISKLGLSPSILVSSSCLNPFMNMPHKSDGTWPILLPVSKAGDYLELRAEMPVLWVASVCTMPPPVSALPLTPICVETYCV